MDAPMIEGAAFAPAAVPAGTTALRLYTVRKADLPRLPGLRTLPLTHLELRWITAPDLTAVPLPATLKSLVIWQSPKLKSLRGVERAPALESLVWRDTGALEDATPLAALPLLRSLAIEGGMSSPQKVSDLRVLAELALTELTLRGIAGAALDLGPVAAMQSLRTLDIHGLSFPPRELAKVAARHPVFYADLMALPDYPASLGMACTRCGGAKKELFLQKSKWLWCPVCEAKGLARKLDGFREMVAEAGGPPPQPH